ncbi:hypothetical protein Esti_000068 [Eimeria stiedai]
MPKPPPSPEASIPIINSYCNERHNGKLVCVLDPLKGRTLRATKAFAVGDLILKEPPLHAVRLDPDSLACTKLMEVCEKHSFKHPAIWYWCALNSVLVEDDPPVTGLQAVTRRQWELLRTLFIPEVVEPSSEATTLVDCMGLRGIVDEVDLEIMIQVWLHNCFEHQRDPEGYIIYFMPSFCSHSCIPNALWCTDDDSSFLFFPRATITAGDEVTLTYLPEEDMLASTSRRRTLLEGAKDFKCMCERCVAPVDFSRGFRCPRCRSGVIYAHADDTGTKQAFNGALLMPPEDNHPNSGHSTSARDLKLLNLFASAEQRADTAGQPVPSASMRPGQAHASTGHSQMLENQRKPKGITLYTIWARLVDEHNEFLRKEVKRSMVTSSESNPPLASSKDAAERRAPPDGVGDASDSLLSSFRETSALVSPELVSKILQKLQSGRCYMCNSSWTDGERKRALAVEKVVEATYSRFEETESEYSVSFSKNGINELLSEWTSSKEPFFAESEMADKRARQALAGVDAQTALRILKKGWHLLDRHERTIVDSVIQLTFSSHWQAARTYDSLAAQWFRFLEMNSSPSRKLPHLDRIIWQYRNLYPGLTPAVAWAVWGVAQALLSLEVASNIIHTLKFHSHMSTMPCIALRSAMLEPCTWSLCIPAILTIHSVPQNFLSLPVKHRCCTRDDAIRNLLSRVHAEGFNDRELSVRLQENPKLENLGSFQQYADQCIVSSYNESVFILSILFGANSSFTASIVDDYGNAIANCKDRLMQQTAPRWKDILLAKFGDSESPKRLNDPQFPNVWPCYISFCADLLISTSAGSARIFGNALIEAYRSDS